MDDTIRVFSGREFKSEDIELIRWTCRTYSTLSRPELASTVCEFLGWLTDAGKPKLSTCSRFFEVLEEEGLIELPSIRKHAPRKTKRVTEYEFKAEPLCGDVNDLGLVHLKIARTKEEMERWAAYIRQYHMLGYTQVLGCQIRYFILVGEREVGCLLFSASAWSLKHRDAWIGWETNDRKVRLHLIVNNSRFLLCPWVEVRNLASKALSIVARQIQEDWLKMYCYAPVLLETFVDLAHFSGVCYKAANWIYLGETQGRGRNDRENKKALSRKAIFMYPLQKDFKACLKGEKPYRTVSPDE